MTLQFPLVAYFSILLTVGLLCTGYALLRRCRQSGDYLTFRFVGIIIGVSLWWLVMSTVKFTATSLELKILFYRLSMAAWIGLPVSTCIFLLSEYIIAMRPAPNYTVASLHFSLDFSLSLC